MMMLAVCLSTIDLLFILIAEILKPPKYLLGVDNLLRFSAFS